MRRPFGFAKKRNENKVLGGIVWFILRESTRYSQKIEEFHSMWYSI